MRMVAAVVGMVLAFAGCAGGRPEAEQRLVDLAGVRDARVAEEPIDDGVRETTATVDMEAGATEGQIAAALEALGGTDALFRDLTVGAGNVETAGGGADRGPGVYRVDFEDGGAADAATLARWFAAARARFGDAEVAVGLNEIVEIRLDGATPAVVADAADAFRAEPRLRDASVAIFGSADGPGTGAELRGDAGFDGGLADGLRALATTTEDVTAPVTRLAVWDARRDAAWLMTDLQLGDDPDPDSVTTERFGETVGPMLRAQLNLLRTLPAGSRVKLQAGRTSTTFLDVAAKPRPRGGETYGGPGWNEAAIAYLRDAAG